MSGFLDACLLIPVLPRFRGGTLEPTLLGCCSMRTPVAGPKSLFVGFLAALLASLGLAHADQRPSIELIPASPADGFNFPYVLRIPEKVSDKPVLLVETNNTGNSDDFEETVAATVATARGSGIGPMISGALNMPLVIPVFPRPKTDWQIYTHALDRDSILLEEGHSLHRLDLQLLAMSSDARKRLSRNGIEVPPEFLICGFSASGTFANRFSFLHPKRILGVVAGGVNATPMLPLADHGEHSLSFPLGTNDFGEIVGREFDLEAWRALPQMIFMGALDDNDAVAYSDAYSDSERETVHKVLGQDMGVRWRAAQALYLEEKANVTFVTYGQIGHATTHRIHRDILSFVNYAIKESR